MNSGERIVGEVSLAFANLSANMTTEGLAIHNQALRKAADDINGLLAQLDAARAEVERLRAVVDKLPKTADGVPITPGMSVWPGAEWLNDYEGFPDDGAVVVGFPYVQVKDSQGEKGDGLIDLDEDEISGCYSTREAAEAAKETP